MVVFKYPLEFKDEQTVEFPSRARPLHVGSQNERAMLWALVTPPTASNAWRLKPQTWRIRMVGTGYQIDTEWGESLYLGTIMVNDGKFVFHFFALATEE